VSDLDPSDAAPLGLFAGYGVELEYMIVDAKTLDVQPVADRLIEAESGAIENEIERGDFAWSNELARHVVEIKTNGPAPALAGLVSGFDAEIARIESLLAPMDACLLPTAMHPWMDPTREFALWPHGDREIYAAFDRIFDCTGHGWANLQSAHLNLPFADDDEFGRLHAAIRALLPLLPALAAASPFLEGRHPGMLDARLDVYRSNARRVPSVSGAVIPEPVFTRRDYEALLASIYGDLAPLDPAGTLRHEWVNARGAIARFDRMALEIRVLDVQECPAADLAIAGAVACVLEALCDPAPAHQARLRDLATPSLAALLARTTADADAAIVADVDLLAALGLPAVAQRADAVWSALVDRHVRSDPRCTAHLPALEGILSDGPLARRILRRTGPKPDRAALSDVYTELADCLREGLLFRSGAREER
jgi:gamma-glutamyl:cysteine ligase YbdK (ATP-grasp superfamily)